MERKSLFRTLPIPTVARPFLRSVQLADHRYFWLRWETLTRNRHGRPMERRSLGSVTYYARISLWTSILLVRVVVPLAGLSSLLTAPAMELTTCSALQTGRRVVRSLRWCTPDAST